MYKNTYLISTRSRNYPRWPNYLRNLDISFLSLRITPIKWWARYGGFVYSVATDMAGPTWLSCRRKMLNQQCANNNSSIVRKSQTSPYLQQEVIPMWIWRKMHGEIDMGGWTNKRKLTVPKIPCFCKCNVNIQIPWILFKYRIQILVKIAIFQDDTFKPRSRTINGLHHRN